MASPEIGTPDPVAGTVEVKFDTPCGKLGLKIPFPSIPLPDINLYLDIPIPPPLPRIPFPDCSVLKHFNSAPEPPEDSVP